MAASKKLKLSPKHGLPFKTANKQKRQELFAKQKRVKEESKRKASFARKKEEDKNPRLRTERLRNNQPLTIDRKRVWDNVDSDDEFGLGASVDIERAKRQKTEEEENNSSLDGVEETGDAGEDEDSDRDSMLDTTDTEDEESGGNPKRQKSLQSTPRASSPTRSTASTNLSITPEALATKFPSLFENDERIPKILVTTGINSTLHYGAQLLTTLFPNSVYIPRSQHRYSHKYSVREIAGFAANRKYTAVVVLNEDQKRPIGLDIVHISNDGQAGPMFHFSISNWLEGKKIPGHGRPTNHYPELILNNFRTPLGFLTARSLQKLWPPQPEVQGRTVVTLHNQRDFIFVRRHRYIFREKRETEKAVLGADGKEFKGVEGIKTGLQELGPRFTLKLRRIDKGVQRASGQEWEWKGKTDKIRTKFQL
jgi:ribosome production factor 1